MTARLEVPLPARSARVAVIGDVGGHHDALRAELARLGADAHGRLPDDLVVIQVGDLVHRGPDSAGVIRLVDERLAQQPDQWIQLVGNHEAQYLREPAFHWPERLDAAAQSALLRWRRDGQLLAAASLTTADGERVLISHAGLTAGFWREVLDAPVRASTAAERLNDLLAADDDRLFRGGTMLGGVTPNPAAGPLWAEAAVELLPSWEARQLPFSQLHGHSAATSSQRLSPPLAARTIPDRAAGHEVTTLAGGRIVGVDPGHGRRPCRSWRSLVLD